MSNHDLIPVSGRGKKENKPQTNLREQKHTVLTVRCINEGRNTRSILKSKFSQVFQPNEFHSESVKWRKPHIHEYI